MKADKQQLHRSCVLCLCAGQLIYILLTHQKTIKLTMLYLAHVENHAQKLVVWVFSYCKQHQNTMRAVREKCTNSVNIHAAPRMEKYVTLSARSTRMHAVQAVEDVSSVLKYSKRAAVTLRVATQAVETCHRYQKISKMRQWEDVWKREVRSCRLFLQHACPLARMYTHYVSVKVPQHCSQIKREDKPLKWTIRLWLFSIMALLPLQERKNKQTGSATDTEQFFTWTSDGWETASTKSHIWLRGVTHDWVQHLETNIQYIAPKDKRWTQEKQVSAVIAYG